MGRLVKIFLYVVGAFVALLIVAAVSFFLFFDANDFRDRIAAEIKETTGRELLIEGDLELSFFPWLAIGIGKTTLGNPPGFGDEAFATFEQARLSVRMLPMLLRRDLSIGAAELDSLEVNLIVLKNGRSNWQDLTDGGDAAAEETDTADRSHGSFDLASINISNAALRYIDAGTGDNYQLTELNLKSGRVVEGEAVPLSGELKYELQPADIIGDAEFETTVKFDSDEQVITLGELELSVLGVDISADVEPFSYADRPQPVARIEVDAFSPRNLMQRMNVEAPETADPNALGKATLEATARVGTDTIAMTDVRFVLDQTTFSGALALPLDANGRYQFELAADSIDLDRYMAPVADPGASGEDEAQVEIPADLIQTLNIAGKLAVDEAHLSGMKFETVDVNVRATNGELRLNPITAKLFDGTYKGNVRINATGALPVLSVNENVTGVQLGSLAQAMFEQDNVTGTISGSFKLTGSGKDVAAIQRSLNGNMDFELADGAFEGTDVWYELRRARALFRQEAAPEPVLPARTEFSSVVARGPVTDGVFRNDEVRADLPFMQISGRGTVDLAAATMDYRLSARVLEKPEFVQGATEEELDEFTEAVIPLRITGPLSSPSVKPDIEDMLKKEVKKEVEKQLLDKLLGGSRKKKKDKAAEDGAAEDAAAEDGAADAEQEKEKDIEDELEDALKDIFKRP